MRIRRFPEPTATGGTGGLLGIQVLSTVEVADYTPTSGTTKIYVEVIGSGGGGGGAIATAASTEASCGAGGGGGGYAAVFIAIADIGDFEYKVGAGGAGGVAGAAGSAGQTCYFGLDSGLVNPLASVSGGGGGNRATVAAGAATGTKFAEGGFGGIANDGDVQTRGIHGDWGWATCNNALYPSAFGGAGGPSMYGEGARADAIELTGSQTGWDADSAGSGTGYGGGGGGGSNAGIQSAVDGGDGRQGIIVVYEYV